MKLLLLIDFDPQKDVLWLAGDLINRGPDSLATLRFIHQHRTSIKAVLGNHDLHLLSCAAGHRKPKGRDTLESILIAPDREPLLKWLAKRPLVIEKDNFLMVHAGLLPAWSLDEVRQRARAVEALLKGPKRSALLAALQGKPSTLKNKAHFVETLSVMTRLRMIDRQGRAAFGFAGAPEQAPPGERPWFSLPPAHWAGTTVIFGHWAALGRRIMPGFYALDSGCVWGNALSAIRLEDAKIFEAPYAS